MRLIDADSLIYQVHENFDEIEVYGSGVTIANLCEDKINEAPTVDLWHYPSKGDYPPSGEEVLCWLWGTTPDVGCWNEKDELWHFDEFEEETVDCWQYIVPPKEEI